MKSEDSYATLATRALGTSRTTQRGSERRRSTSKLYLIVRADLSAGQQAVQAAHALRQFAAEHPEVDQEWFLVSNTLAFLEVPDERALGVLLERAATREFPVAAFFEPDRDYELTALAMGPSARKLCSGLVLALQGL
jgi:peptidyl-tRNA hydrolase